MDLGFADNVSSGLDLNHKMGALDLQYKDLFFGWKGRCLCSVVHQEVIPENAASKSFCLYLTCTVAAAQFHKHYSDPGTRLITAALYS